MVVIHELSSDKYLILYLKFLGNTCEICITSWGIPYYVFPGDGSSITENPSGQIQLSRSLWFRLARFTRPANYVPFCATN